MNNWPFAFTIAALIITGLLMGYQSIFGSDLWDAALMVCSFTAGISLLLLWLRTR